MSVSGQVSITSSIGTSLVFTVTGTNTLGYAKAFEKILVNAGTVTENLISATGTQTTVTGSGDYTLTLNEITTTGSFTLPTADPHAITFVDQNGAATVTGSGVNDYVMFTGINPSATYQDKGGNNTVIFTTGNNTYKGDGESGKDVIVAGSGDDTIITGTGPDTVFSGTGRADITLNDTSAGAFSGSFNDFVHLDDGTNTVHASGAADAIFATAPGQVIYGSDVAGGATIVTLIPDSTGGVGNDTIYGGAASIALFDSVGGNTFNAGSGQAYFVAASGVADTVNSSGGPVYMFGSDGDSITFAGNVGSVSDPAVLSGFAAGAGNETLNGAEATTYSSTVPGGPASALVLYANNTSDSVAAQNVNDSLVGGNGATAFVTGEGNETLTGGLGSNRFYIQHSADNTDANTGTITVQDFANTNWQVGFAGYTQEEIANAEANASVNGGSDPSYTIKLSDGTTVQFLGVTTLTGHTF